MNIIHIMCHATAEIYIYDAKKIANCEIKVKCPMLHA